MTTKTSNDNGTKVETIRTTDADLAEHIFENADTMGHQVNLDKCTTKDGRIEYVLVIRHEGKEY